MLSEGDAYSSYIPVEADVFVRLHWIILVKHILDIFCVYENKTPASPILL